MLKCVVDFLVYLLMGRAVEGNNGILFLFTFVWMKFTWLNAIKELQFLLQMQVFIDIQWTIKIYVLCFRYVYTKMRF